MKMSRNNLYLPSNKLNDIAEFFGIGEKLSTNKDLWFDCMAGDKKAWGLMEKYNKQDVVLCDELYTKLLPYTKQFNTYIDEEGLSLRGSFVIDPNGILKAFELHDNSIGRSASELLRKLQAAIYVREHGGEVCPANWKPGSQTLKPSLDLVGKI